MLQFYGLREQPFGTTPDPRYVYPLAANREALAALLNATQYRVGFAALIAEPGLGKTTILFDILDQYSTKASTAFIFNTQCTAKELLRQIAEDLGVAAAPEMAQLHENLKAYVAKRAVNQPVLVVIDEAQNLDDEALEAVRLLSDFETADCKLLHIILAGQPELANKLKQPHLVQLLQRITVVTRLSRLTADETAGYIRHRLGVAGGSDKIFAPDAIARIAEHSGGVPREINRLCFNSLVFGCAVRQPIIDRALVDEVIIDQQLPHSHAARTPETSFPPTSLGKSRREATPTWTSTVAVSGANALHASLVNERPVVLPDPLPFSKVAERPVPAAVSSPALPVEEHIAASPVPKFQPPIEEPVPLAPSRNLMEIAPVAPVSPAPSVQEQARQVFSFVAPYESVAEAAPVEPAPPVPAVQERTKPPVRPDPIRSIFLESSTESLVPLPIETGPHAVVLWLERFWIPVAALLVAVLATSAGLYWVRSQAKMAASMQLTANQAAPGASESGDTSGKVADVEVTASAPAKRKRQKSPAIVVNEVPTASVIAPPVVKPSPSSVLPATNLSSRVASPVRAKPFTVGAPTRPAYQISQAKLLRMVKPDYPATAKTMRVEGEVLLMVTVGNDGKVKRLRVEQGDSRLATAATEAVSQWIYEPATLDGRPVATQLSVSVKFSLPQPRDTARSTPVSSQ
jgi:general secretion pathway protein A